MREKLSCAVGDVRTMSPQLDRAVQLYRAGATIAASEAFDQALLLEPIDDPGSREQVIALGHRRAAGELCQRGTAWERFCHALDDQRNLWAQEVRAVEEAVEEHELVAAVAGGDFRSGIREQEEALLVERGERRQGIGAASDSADRALQIAIAELAAVEHRHRANHAG